MSTDRRVGDINKPMISEYEKDAKVLGVSVLLFACLLAATGWHPVGLFGVLWGMFIANPWRHPMDDYTETEIRLSHKATALTCYWVLAIACTLFAFLGFLLPKETSLEAIAEFLANIVLVSIGVRYIVLACLLRKARLPSPGVNSHKENLSDERSHSAYSFLSEEWTYSFYPRLPEEEKNDRIALNL